MKLQYILYLSLTAIVISGCWFSSSQNQEPSDQTPVAPPPVEDKQAPKDSILFEEPDKHAASEDDPQVHPDNSMSITHNKAVPRIAIIIDDMGYHHKIGAGLLALDLELTFSFLPWAPFTTELEDLAYQQGRDIMAHLPMEASNKKWDPGPGALFLAAPPRKLVSIIRKDLAQVPHAIGANNHMGSKFTTNRKAMQTVLKEIKKQGLFFIDSFTTSKSKGLREARALGIKAARRHVFLDNVQNRKKICIQLQKLTNLAQKKQQAIGIGHPYQATLDALKSCQEPLLKDVQLVPVHELLQ